MNGAEANVTSNAHDIGEEGGVEHRGMLEAKPSSPGSSGTSRAAAHIHAQRRWAAPLLASVLLSSLFFSSSRMLLLSFSPLPSAASTEPLFVEAKLRQQMRAKECPARGVVPRIAYLISGSARDGAALRRTLRALYHLANTYVVHLDLEAPAAERAELAAAVRADLVYARFRNVKVVTRANLVTYHGPTMVVNTQYAARGCHPAARGRQLFGGFVRSRHLLRPWRVGGWAVCGCCCRGGIAAWGRVAGRRRARGSRGRARGFRGRRRSTHRP
jgi:hypothetical protein